MRIKDKNQSGEPIIATYTNSDSSPSVSIQLDVLPNNAENLASGIYTLRPQIEISTYDGITDYSINDFKICKGPVYNGGGSDDYYVVTDSCGNFDFNGGSSEAISDGLFINTQFPKIKIIDFLKGIFQMFKLVVIPQPNGIIYVNTLKDYYSQGQLYDVTEYINFESYEVARGEILSEINYNFQDPKTIANLQFKENTSIAYGDLEAILRDTTTGEVLEGGKIDINLPFEQFIYDRLVDQETGENTNVVYSAIIDEKKEGVNPKPHIFITSTMNYPDKR